MGVFLQGRYSQPQPVDQSDAWSDQDLHDLARAAMAHAEQSELRIVKLGGLLDGYDFSPELTAKARREMWLITSDQAIAAGGLVQVLA